MNRNSIFSVVILFSFSLTTLAGSYDLTPAKKILALPEHQIDLAQAKLVIDKTIDSETNIKQSSKQLDLMVREIRKLAGPFSTDSNTMMVMMDYLYEKGDWNNGIVFSYDLDEPMGRSIKNKMLTHYLQTRKGNCVSMPMLLVILGQKLGIDVSLVRAPLHLFVHFKDETGKIYNIEGVEKGTVSDERYRNEYFLTQEAIDNGLYLQSLSKKQAVTEMLMTVLQHFEEQGDYENVLKITDLVILNDKKSVDAMLKKGSAYGYLSRRFLTRHNFKLNQTEDNYYQKLRYNNHYWFSKAESLGWRELPKDRDEKYLAFIQNIKSEKQETEESGNENH